MSLTLPAIAAAQLGAELVGNRRGRVLHLTTGALTPTGRLPRTARVRCGQRARGLRRWPVDGRPLCARCTRHAPADQLGRVDLPRAEVAPLIALTLRTARDLRTVAAARLIACGMPTEVVDGQHLHVHVRSAQARLAGPPPMPIGLVTHKPTPEMSQRSRRAQARTRVARMLDLPERVS